MSKSKVHALKPNTSQAACGAPHIACAGSTRESITCKVCKQTVEYKNLPNKSS
jgi:hypothetical protein